ncbi:hypothetical protein PROFUN_10108 [Planoprotostelium fungivorum]|uniref:Leucine-rich repeat-containing N-terminal plant-type domain-containing protein n=1 Tax=Planoprotostelium fungivorum TaxID=1890364 RepID=A0A2P6NEN0_9EUKA|nr:hypothetical protein PROFUN_10108 [Planoprotostelium fungivorum]
MPGSYVLAVASYLLVLSCIATSSAQQSGIEFDTGARGILEEFYVALDGPGWINRTNWLTNAHYCSWYGIVCDPQNNSSVIEINLDNNGLNGQMKFSIGNLRELRRISLAENDILGRLPPTIQQCKGLTYLNFSNNLLDSVIPPEYGTLDKLEIVDLGQNLLQGSIPSSLGGCADLIYLNLRENRLSGEIPANLGNLTEVVYINMSFNQLTRIPRMGEHMEKLEILDLSNNQLIGMVPETIQEIPNLKHINLSHNDIKVFENFVTFDNDHITCDFSNNSFFCPLNEKELACKATCERHRTVPGIAVASIFALVIGLTAGIVFVNTLEKARIREESGVVEDEDDF